MNTVSMVGNLATDVTLRKVVVANGDDRRETSTASFLLAVSRPRRNGEDAGADFIRVEAWGKLGESAARYLAKGRRVAVVGRLRSNRFQAQDGTTRYDLRVVANRIEFLSSPRKDQASRAPEPEPEPEDIPF